ncbi:MAG TPA: hypothetical protein PLD95_00175 [bacterium]|mgnify:CR=1 FL=1|jgi:hypothetical protein|nr:hypothetical protein [bacterium]HOG37873.1 hypothetical protein [bacterium]
MECDNPQVSNNNPYSTFWWFLLLVITKTFYKSDHFNTGSIFILMGIILFIMFIYWAIGYKNKI